MVTEKEEHEICISCGLCCDATLFDMARYEDEVDEFEYFKGEEVYYENKRFFRLPCPHFDEKCTIYHLKIPDVCKRFKCELLHGAIKGEIGKEEALKLIKKTKEERDSILEAYREKTGAKVSFRELNKIIVKIEDNDDSDLVTIKYRAQLLEILLNKYYKSKNLFDETYEILDE